MVQHASAVSARLSTRLVWAAVAAVVLLAAGPVAGLLTHPHDASVPSLKDLVPFLLVQSGALTYTGIGALISVRQPGNRVGWLLLGTGLAAALANFAGTYSSVALILAPGSLPLGIGAVVILQLLFTYAPPLQELFGTEAIPAHIWPSLFAGGLVFFAVVELEKLVIRAARRAPAAA